LVCWYSRSALVGFGRSPWSVLSYVSGILVLKSAKVGREFLYGDSSAMALIVKFVARRV
jgi:uroporphyrinogen-III decarboxylase